MSGPITLSDIVQIHLTDEELKLGYGFAKRAEIGGRSLFRESEDRKKNLEWDQFRGIAIGELAGNKHFFSVEKYVETRQYRDLNPHTGDDGCDTIGYKIDYKTSELVKDDILSFNLPVRPHDRREGHLYVLILTKAKHTWLTQEELVYGPIKPEVYIVGWATDSMLDGHQCTSGVFGPNEREDGAFLLPIRKLYKIKDLTVDKIPVVSK